ncbi:transcriptional repressor LexA [Proteiniclasticum ruminis]|uniref:Repressor LexA n=1 Tax=Proteiniclasticum ruminis TaxID=398199 RepID=A0A1I4ZJ10_9CLOT|nr:transcriptional repressor LexA [Proteiniclasticum ruminis]SFN50234.1 repressor LexA [Proteiniclasticum ruminis]
MKSSREILSENIRFQLDKHSMEQSDLADKLGVSQSSVSHWINGNKYPRIDTIEKMAEIFNVRKSDITDEPRSRSNSKRIPLIGTIAAGQPILAEQNIEDYFSLDNKIKADFCLRIKGDSMINVNIMDGDIVFIRKQDDLEDGEIGAVLVDDSATLKRFFRENGSVILQSENFTYKPMVISKGEVRILGKMVASLRQYK